MLRLLVLCVLVINIYGFPAEEVPKENHPDGSLSLDENEIFVTDHQEKTELTGKETDQIKPYKEFDDQESIDLPENHPLEETDSEHIIVPNKPDVETVDEVITPGEEIVDDTEQSPDKGNLLESKGDESNQKNEQELAEISNDEQLDIEPVRVELTKNEKPNFYSDQFGYFDNLSDAPEIIPDDIEYDYYVPNEANYKSEYHQYGLKDQTGEYKMDHSEYEPVEPIVENDSLDISEQQSEPSQPETSKIYAPGYTNYVRTNINARPEYERQELNDQSEFDYPDNSYPFHDYDQMYDDPNDSYRNNMAYNEDSYTNEHSMGNPYHYHKHLGYHKHDHGDHSYDHSVNKDVIRNTPNTMDEDFNQMEDQNLRYGYNRYPIDFKSYHEPQFQQDTSYNPIQYRHDTHFMQPAINRPRKAHLFVYEMNSIPSPAVIEALNKFIAKKHNKQKLKHFKTDGTPMKNNIQKRKVSMNDHSNVKRESSHVGAPNLRDQFVFPNSPFHNGGGRPFFDNRQPILDDSFNRNRYPSLTSRDYGSLDPYGLNYNDQVYLYNALNKDNRLRYLLQKVFGI